MKESDTINFNLTQPNTVSSLSDDLIELGISPGMTLIVHSSLCSLGWVCGGASAVIQALEEALSQDILQIPRKGKGLDQLEKGLRSVGIKGLFDGMSGDELDAATCALVGIMYLKGKFQALGDPGEILMMLPPGL